MGKPVERQNHSLSFFILATLIAISTAWSFYEEFLGRRPWKEYQERIFSYEKEKAHQDLRFVERKLESGEIKVVPDPAKPDATVTVADAKKRLEELERTLAQDRDALGGLKKQITEAEIVASDADLRVKYLKSEDDGLFYEFQHAEHEEALHNAAAAKALASEGGKAAADVERKLAAEYGKHKDEARVAREKKAEEIRQAEAGVVAAEKALNVFLDQQRAKVGERDRLKAAIDLALDPIIAARTGMENISKKSTELTQYWLTSYDNSVDRCQNCHSSVDKCGFSRPHEVIEALNAPNAKPEDVATNFCLNPDTITTYTETAAEVCAVEFDHTASLAKKIEKGVCYVKPEERERVAEFFANYCGESSKAHELLVDPELDAACLDQGNYEKLAPYLEGVAERKVCDLTFKAEGETCVEGAKRDQLLTYLSRDCADTSSAIKTLKPLSPKACAAGEDGKKLANVKPVLYDYPVWAQTHPFRTELLGSAHPPDRFGCTSCHEGQGAQTKGVAGSAFHHGYDDHYWDRPMLDLVAHKRYRPTSFSPPSSQEGVPGRWVTHEKQYAQATCAKCHTEEVHLKFADTYTAGRRLIAEIGCHGCHPVDTFREFPKVGPTLTDLKKKTTPAFLMTWVSYPKAFRPRTKMPNFWPEAIKADEARSVRQGTPEFNKRAEEVQKIVAYLWKHSEEAHLPAIPVTGNADHGKVLAQQVGCRGCHNFVPPEKLCTEQQIADGKSRGTPTEPGECEVARSITGSNERDFAPNLSNIGWKAKDRWLYAWLKNPTAMWAGTRMPNLRLSDQDAADITAYLLTLKAGAPLSEQPFFDDEASPAFVKAAEEGGKLIGKYGCAGCHQIKGHEDDPKIGADLNEYGRKTVDLLDFGNAVPNPRHHSWYNFVDLKLRAPRAYGYERVEARMPQFDLSGPEVDRLMVFLKSRSPEKIPASYLVANNERRAAIAHGDQVMEYFNCKACHTIDGDGGRIRDIYAEDDLVKAPPVLQQQGWRVQPDWLFGFLRDPSDKLRPRLDVRMPTFPLGDDRATALVRAFAANANVSYPYLSVQKPVLAAAAHDEAKAMVEDQFKCFSCHASGDAKLDAEKATLAPDLRRAKRRLRPDWIVAWLKNPNSLQEGTQMPGFFTPDSLDTVLFDKYFAGSQVKQIEALRDFVMSLPDDAPTTGPSKPQAQR